MPLCSSHIKEAFSKNKGSFELHFSLPQCAMSGLWQTQQWRCLAGHAAASEQAHLARHQRHEQQV
jgi:hypothetical protein